MQRKRKTKSKEEKATEEFFPVDAGGIKRTTEKIVKEMPATNIIGTVTKTVAPEKTIESLTKTKPKRIPKKTRAPKKTKEEKKNILLPTFL